MQFTFVPVLLALAVSVALCGGVATYCLVRRSSPGALALGATLLASAWWCAAYALELAGTDLATKLFWAHLKFIALASVVPLWFVFILCIGERTHLLRRFAPLAVLPLVTVALALLDDPGGLLYASARLDAAPPFALLRVSYGPWFGIHLAFNMALMSLGVFFALREFCRPAALARRQALIVLLSAVPPTLGSWSRFFGWGPWPGLDFAPFAFALMGLLMIWAFYGERVFDLVPVAREAVIEGMRDAVMVLDPQGRLLDLNPAARRLLPDGGDPIGLPIAALNFLPPALLADRSADGAATIAVVVDGESRSFDLTRSPLILRGALRGSTVSARDCTERERALAQVAHLAQHDALTGLLNRATFIERLDRALAAGDGATGALLFLDLDGFKEVNDTYGHATGDWLLTEVAARLRALMPPDGLLARLGGDEFTISLPTSEPGPIADLARAAQRALAAPFDIDGVRVGLAASIGGAVAPDDGRDAAALLHAADVAMYVTKDAGRTERSASPPRDLEGLNRPMARGYTAAPSLRRAPIRESGAHLAVPARQPFAAPELPPGQDD